MSCAHCSSHQDLAVEIATLKRQNDDLMKMLASLMKSRIELKYSTLGMTEQKKFDAAEYDKRLLKHLAAAAIRELERVLQPRQDLYREIDTYQFLYPLMFKPRWQQERPDLRP